MTFIPSTASAIVAGLVENRLVPFVGAGASFARLKVDWNALREEMCAALSLDPSAHNDPLEVADLFETQKGSPAIADLLEKRLIIDKHDDALSRTHLQILAINPGIIYTTNQDNVFEEMFKAKGRAYHVITSLADLSAAQLTARKLVKYHGDLKDPDSIVFTGASYKRRIADTDHFLNIRMKSDLLAKGFLFIGYSFNDPNVRILFEQIQTIFPAGLPMSYLISFRYSPAMEDLKKDFGINIVDPQECFSTNLPPEEAFDQLLENISTQVFEKKSAAEDANFFSPSEDQSSRVVIGSELKAAKNLIEIGPFEEAIKAFRVAVDASNIPDHLVSDVVDAIKSLSDRVCSEEELSEFPGLLMNLRLRPDQALVPIAWIMKAINRHGNENGMPNFPLIYPPANRILAGAAAIAIVSLRDENQPISKKFLNHLDFWLQEFRSLPDNLQSQVKEAVTWAYGGSVPYNLFGPPLLETKTYDEIYDALTANLPRGFRKKVTD